MLNEIINRLPDGRAEKDLARYLRILSEDEIVLLVESLLRHDSAIIRGTILKLIPKIISSHHVLIKFLDIGLAKKNESKIKFWINATSSGLGYKRLLQHLLKVAETNPDWIVYAWYQLVPIIKKEAPDQVDKLQKIKDIIDNNLCDELKDFWQRNQNAVPL